MKRTIDDAIRNDMDSQDLPIEPAEVRCDETAAWAIGHAATNMREIERIEAVAEARIRQIGEWANEEIKRLTHHNKYFLAPVEEWLRQKLADGKKKSEKFFDATVGFRKMPTRVVIDDATCPPLDGNWKGDGAEFILPIPKPKTHRFDSALIKEAITKDGLDISWVKLEGGEKKFYIKLNDIAKGGAV